MHHSELTEIATAELKQHGIKPQITHTNGGHIEIAWRVVPEKELRRVITSKTGSDWRARMNLRAEVRRLLRADNVALKQETKPKKHPELAKALNLPQEVVPLPDQVSALRGEVADLTALMTRVAKVVGSLRDTVAAQVVPPPPKPEPPSSRSVKIKEYLSLDRWVSLSALARDTGLSPKQIKLKLDYLARLGELTVYQGQAKLNAVEPRPKKPRGRAAHKAKVVKKAKGTNGHRHRIAAP
ncbi:hypothetical protein CQ14_06965 [Bradyrhizobium lablabi]|uniref:Uncharacterized protein n=1 Tax=Bradyrhizobium lablabi TaxID=722472 RepID=A0A0R3MM57_9BRAD|nr:hypothetical protein [Bradyrhizobium lablabi]KRR21384.1 hypothetical protein CQ14_06965 [Bradyrhizobium lablabi]